MRHDEDEIRSDAACAGRAARVRSPMESGPASPATPLPPSAFAAGGMGQAERGERRAGRPSRHVGFRRRDMIVNPDAELEKLRRSVNCAVVLERSAVGWSLDKGESTKRALKYRRGAGEIIIINHEGRGWWDATSSAKGDVFGLVQHLDPALNFGEVRQTLRRLIGLTPGHPALHREKAADGEGRPPAARWAERPLLSIGDPAWRYLNTVRQLPRSVLKAAARQDVVRRGSYDSAWFAHGIDGAVTHVEIRSATYRGSLRGGTKTLFCFDVAADRFRRLAVLEAPIDALSLAAIEDQRTDTIYVATGGGMGPGTIDALQATLKRLPSDGKLISAADANRAGDRFAERHAELAHAAGAGFERLRPPEGQDWNDVLVKRREP